MPRQLQDQAAVVYPNVRVHPSTVTTQSEVPITTHPLNPDFVLGSANAVPPAGVFSTSRLGLYYTTDGGTTWKGHDTLPSYPTRPSYDPTVVIDLDGNLFVGGKYENPDELIVAMSSDTGTTWSQTTVPKPNSNVVEDKPHLTVDVNPGSPFKNYIYAGYSDTRGSGLPWPVMFSRSTDRGVHFSTGVPISGSVAGASDASGINLAVGPNSELYAVWSAEDRFPPLSTDSIQLGFNKSTDGGATWQGAQSILRLRTLPFTTTKGGNCIRFSGSLPVLGVDRSNGPRRGWIYVVYPAGTAATPDIFLLLSSDSGTSWSSPARVNQDNSGKDQWLPWMSVDPSNGALYVIYYDSRNFVGNDSAQVYISASFDGGGTFEDVLVSDVPFLPRTTGWSDQCYMGDYIGIAALNSVVWPFWNDNRTGIHQAYTSRVFYPPTSVSDLRSEVPTAFALKQNYPNPFNPSTNVTYELPRSAVVRLSVYDMLGREVSVLVDERIDAGVHEVKFDASGLSSGVYFYRLQAGTFVETRKLLLLR